MELEQRKSETSISRPAAPLEDVEYGHTTEHMGPVAKGYKIGPITLPAYRSPLAQTILIAFVCFLVVGKSGCHQQSCTTESLTARARNV